MSGKICSCCGQLLCRELDADDTQYYVDENWKRMPHGSRKLLANDDYNHDVDIGDLVEFWRTHPDRGLEWDPDTSWVLAGYYLEKGWLHDARNLMLSGAFLQFSRQLLGYVFVRPSSDLSGIKKGIRTIDAGQKKWGEVDWDRWNRTYKMALDASSNLCPRAMMKYLFHVMRESEDPAPETTSTSSADLITWNQEEAKKCARSGNNNGVGNDEDEVIQIVLLNENTQEVSKKSIGRSTELKKLFNDYAEEKGVSLRSLRFSYKGAILFLSSAGNSTPSEMNMVDFSMITVTDTTRCGGALQDDPSNGGVNDPGNNPGKKTSSSKKGKKKGKKGKRK